MNNEYAVMQCEYALMNMYWTLRTNASWSTAMVKAKIYAGLFNFAVVGMNVVCLLCVKKERLFWFHCYAMADQRPSLVIIIKPSWSKNSFLAHEYLLFHNNNHHQGF